MFLPITTPGTDARLKPDTSNGHALVKLRQCSPTCAKVDGIEVARCGSFPALPCRTRCAPDTAQEFDPICPSVRAEHLRNGLLDLGQVGQGRARPPELTTLRPIGAERADIRSAVGSNASPSMVPRLTMGSKSWKGYRGRARLVRRAPTFAVMIASWLS